MNRHTVTVRNKGQITLPAELRRELGISDGDCMLVQLRGREIVLISPNNVVDPTAGALAKYAYRRNPDPAEERNWVAEYIAETTEDHE
jgi:AbrB family looped-hinge helix DNA binding protein